MSDQPIRYVGLYIKSLTYTVVPRPNPCESVCIALNTVYQAFSPSRMVRLEFSDHDAPVVRLAAEIDGLPCPYECLDWETLGADDRCDTEYVVERLSSVDWDRAKRSVT